MSGALKPYPRYKESGVEWLGAVPEGWEVVPYKTVGTHNDEVLPESTPEDLEFDYVEIGNVSLNDGIRNHSKVSFAHAPSRARRIARTGDVLVSTVRTYLKAIAIVPDREIPYVASTGFAVLRPGKRLVSSYLGRIVQSEYFVSEVIARSVGVSYPAINATEVVALPIPLPPLPEQQAIADYLDAETQRIDTLIAELREMIRLLKEKRQALISHCVTKGLDPTVPMKDSGVEWLGEVPEGWEVVRIGLVASVSNGTTPSREKAEYWEGGTVPWVSSAEVNQGIVTTPTDYVTIHATIDCGMRTIRRGSVLIGLIGQGRTRGMSALLQFDACINQNVAAIEPNEKASAEYVRHYLQHAYEPIRQLGRGGQQDALNNELVGSIIMPLPDIEEQHAITARLDRETAKIDRLISETEDTIRLMQERRSALISSVVTGKLQVPGIAEPSGSTLISHPENRS
jgi:type I restriction enzyme, S subunit